MIFEIIENNFVGVAITLFLILFILTNNNFEKRINRLFLGAASCVLILIVEEAWEAQLALAPVYSPLRIPLSAIGYSLRPMIPYLLIIMLKRCSRTQAALIGIPLILNALTAFSALFCTVSFGYTADNEFIRGPLGFTPFAAAALYIAVLLVLTIQECRNGGLMEGMILSAIVLLSFTATVMESAFSFQFIQNPSIATSITFYYLFLHSNRNNRDPLTGALTRRRFYLDAEKHRSVLSAVVSLDLNMNDQYGHIEGDRALSAVSGVIKRRTGARTSLYRTGGDEFMLLCYKMDEERVQQMIGGIRADLEKTDYRCAIGYSLYSPQIELDLACQIADNLMYEDKRRMKAVTPKQA